MNSVIVSVVIILIYVFLGELLGRFMDYLVKRGVISRTPTKTEAIIQMVVYIIFLALLVSFTKPYFSNLLGQ